MDPELLIEAAEQAMVNAYMPYSEYKVGAAVLTTSGEVYTGCNVENAAYTPTTHAEQNALTTAIAEGDDQFEGLAVVTAARDGAAPCGFCRQVIKEFVDDDFPIYCATEDGYRTFTLGELLPESFGPEDVLVADAEGSQ